MSEWKKYKIGDVCNTISDTYKGRADYVVLINTSDVLEGKCLNHTKQPNKNLKGQFKKTFRKGDILYSEIRPANKRFAYIDFESTNYIASTKLMVLRSNENISSKYLYYILQSPNIVDALQSLAETRSGTFPQITFSELSHLEIELPNLEQQARIVKLAESLDDKIELNRRINENLEQQAQALFKHWFVENPKALEWEQGNLNDVISIYDHMRKPLSGQERERMDKIYPYYGAASLMDYVDNYIFDGVYLLLGEDGTVIDEQGYPILQYVYGKFWVNNHAHILKGINGFTTESLYILLKQTNIRSIVTGAVQPKISQTNLKSVNITIPPQDILLRYNEIISPMFGQIRKNNDEIIKLSQLRDTILPKLMNGEITITE